MSSYYANQLDLLRDILGVEDISLEESALIVGAERYPIVDDVVILLTPDKWPAALKDQLGKTETSLRRDATFAPDIQSTFAREWQSFPDILPEHEQEFRQYFDIVDLEELRGKRVCDLGCGIGRWSYFLKDVAAQLVLVDFSEAIFVARHNLRECDKAVFLMGDVQALPIRDNCVDFTFCLGVVHHLPVDALGVVRTLGRLAPETLIYIYSALDGRPWYYKVMLSPVDLVRGLLCRLEHEPARAVLAWLLTLTLYVPLIGIGHLMRPLRLSHFVPLFDFYHGKSLARIRQDAYDRFFTHIEQRFSRDQIALLEDTFTSVTISSGIPMWHFLCVREPAREVAE